MNVQMYMWLVNASNFLLTFGVAGMGHKRPKNCGAIWVLLVKMHLFDGTSLKTPLGTLYVGDLAFGVQLH